VADLALEDAAVADAVDDAVKSRLADPGAQHRLDGELRRVEIAGASSSAFSMAFLPASPRRP
jgi:hypothetical protein